MNSREESVCHLIKRKIFMTDYFKMSVIDATLTVKDHLSRYPDISIDEIISSLSTGPRVYSSLDYANGRKLGDIINWNEVTLHETRKTTLRAILKKMVFLEWPFWARVAHLGLQRVLRVSPSDVLQCLENAGLTSDIEGKEAVEWWSEIALHARMLDDKQKQDMGMFGEMLSYSYETERLIQLGIDSRPELISLYDATAGYDILSYDSIDAQIIELMIEVKAYTGSPHFFLSCNEWDTACNNKTNYIIHLWNLLTKKLEIIPFNRVAPHIPENTGNGVWQSVKISY